MGIEIGFGRARTQQKRRPVVGIDLGTTNSLVARVDDDGSPIMVAAGDGTRILPSVIAFEGEEVSTVGEAAKEVLRKNPENAVYSVKRLMGKGVDDLEEAKGKLPFAIDPESGNVIRVRVGDLTYTPPELSAILLRKLKEWADGEFGEPVQQAVVTVPAYFDDGQRQATKDAGKLAGLDILRIINEPTAAALAYGLGDRDKGRIAVFDFGGGTFDVSILNIRGGVFEVLSTCGDTYLGGDDLDVALVDWLIGHLRSEGSFSSDVSLDDFENVRLAVNAAKVRLSSEMNTIISIQVGNMPAPLEVPLSRSDLESKIRHLVDATRAPCIQAMEDAGVAKGELDAVVLVGGTTRIPMVRTLVEEVFGVEPLCDLNPDEVVALGAAIQADVLVGGRRDMLLLDVTPLSLGIETMGGVMSKIITRNTTIPASAFEEFTTSVDAQTAVDIHVFQGEREFVSDCRSLARFEIPIEILPAGLPRVRVQFMIDANGILHVTARDARTGLERTVEVKPTYGLTDDEVETMLDDALENAETDMSQRLFVESVQEAKTILQALEKSRGYTGELSEEQQKAIVVKEAALSAAMEGSDARKVRTALEEFNAVTRPLAAIAMSHAMESLSGQQG